MWSDRKQDEVAKPDPLLNRTSRGAGEASNMAVIGKGMLIRGQIRSGEHIHVDGEIDGTLQLAGYDLTVAAQGRVRADVTAREVDTAGAIEGNVDASKKITIRRGGRLLGDLRTPGIVIEDGAYFKGKIEIVNSELKEEAGAASGLRKAVG
jgi:cytoskeletal protein CcmA (bactofilin family)